MQELATSLSQIGLPRQRFGLLRVLPTPPTGLSRDPTPAAIHSAALPVTGLLGASEKLIPSSARDSMPDHMTARFDLAPEEP
jgi:hypothetical protein